MAAGKRSLGGFSCPLRRALLDSARRCGTLGVGEPARDGVIAEALRNRVECAIKPRALCYGASGGIEEPQTSYFETHLIRRRLQQAEPIQC
jgi:hypothetical protein